MGHWWISACGSFFPRYTFSLLVQQDKRKNVQLSDKNWTAQLIQKLG